MSAAEARKARFILAERRWRIHEAQIFVAVLGFRRLASIPATARSATTVSGASFGYPIGVHRPGRLADFFGAAWASSGIVVALVMREALR